MTNVKEKKEMKPKDALSSSLSLPFEQNSKINIYNLTKKGIWSFRPWLPLPSLIVGMVTDDM